VITLVTVMTQHVNLVALLPVLIIAGAALLVLVADLFWAPAQRWLAVPLSLVGVLAALVSAIALAGPTPRTTFCLTPGACSYDEDRFAVAFQVIVLASTIVVLLLGRHELADSRLPAGEYHFLLLASVVGALTMAASRDLLSLLVSLEVVSLPAFVLVGLRRDDARSAEAALKFFLISVIATAVTLMGMSLVYGVTGSLQLDQIAAALAQPSSRQPVTSAAIVLTLAGFAFKVSAVPFHAWVPDTYQGAPVPVAAFLSVVSKTAGFAGLVLLLLVGFRPYADVWGPIVAALAVLTMTAGNLVALRQRHAVRLLAWSSVAQAGYILVPLGVAASHYGRSVTLDQAESALLAYLAIYAAMNLGAFGCVIAAGRRSPGQLLGDYRGLASRQPLLAVALAFFLAALAGLPPAVAGLFAKLTVFRAVIDGHLPWLAAVMAVNTVIALYYYAAWAFALFGPTSLEPAVPTRTIPSFVTAAIGVTAAVTIALSVYPEWVLRAADLATGR
jgi:NADH-quinone oxidoreductase subunit N